MENLKYCRQLQDAVRYKTLYILQAKQRDLCYASKKMETYMVTWGLNLYIKNYPLLLVG